jgi:hypothetical protein
MPTPSTSAEPQNTSQLAPGTEYYLGVLHELIDIGVGLARLVHQRAEAEAASPKSPAGPDLASAFECISRAVRRTIMLARKVAEPVAPAAAQHRAAARRRIIREVEDVIQRTPGGDEALSLHAELLDRLDTPDLEDDIQVRPIADIIADICRDLGLAALPGTHPWKRRTAADLATLCARAAEPRAAEPVAAAAAPALCSATPPHARPGSDPPRASAGPDATLSPATASPHPLAPSPRR